jgi:hypothetical protein
MEDVDLVRRARRLGRVVVAREHVVTSGRRWAASGVLRATLVNQVCLAGWMCGVSPERLAAWRDGTRAAALGTSS